MSAIPLPPKAMLPIADFHQQFPNLDLHHDSFDLQRPEWYDLPKVKSLPPFNHAKLAIQLHQQRTKPSKV